MIQQSRKIWSNFMCPYGPFLLAQSQIFLTNLPNNLCYAICFIARLFISE